MLGLHLRGRLFGFNKSDSGRFRHQPTLSRETAGYVDEGHKRNTGVYDVNGDNCDIFLERRKSSGDQTSRLSACAGKSLTNNIHVVIQWLHLYHSWRPVA
jgi:hypothetical protein